LQGSSKRHVCFNNIFLDKFHSPGGIVFITLN
jgi:hypothetical protein